MNSVFLNKSVQMREQVGVEDMPFYKILQVLEKRARLTEKEVIRRLGIPRSTYRSWKDGTSEPSRRVYWRKLTRVFNVSSSELIFGVDPRSFNL